MADPPADVEDRYRQLAAQRGWTSQTEAAFWSSVAWHRALDEGPGPRWYYECVDHEGLVDKDARWLWEAVRSNDEIVPVKQIDVPSSGVAHRYWWQRLEDDAGMLTDQALELDHPGMNPIPRSTFYALWDGIDR